MGLNNEKEEVFVDYLSEYSVCSNLSDDSDIIIYGKHPGLPL